MKFLSRFFGLWRLAGSQPHWFALMTNIEASKTLDVLVKFTLRFFGLWPLAGSQPHWFAIPPETWGKHHLIPAASQDGQNKWNLMKDTKQIAKQTHL